MGRVKGWCIQGCRGDGVKLAQNCSSGRSTGFPHRQHFLSGGKAKEAFPVQVGAQLRLVGFKSN